MWREQKKNMNASKSNKTKAIIIVITLFLLISVGAGLTIAYVKSESGSVSNTFSAAKAPSPSVEEQFDKQTKSNVKIKLSNNAGEGGTYYIRAEIVITLQDGAGNTIAKVPVKDVDYSIALNTGDWTEAADGYYYYKGTVLPGGTTTNLINTCTTKNTEYKLVVDVLAQSVQANPDTAVKESWGMQYSGGSWSTTK